MTPTTTAPAIDDALDLRQLPNGADRLPGVPPAARAIIAEAAVALLAAHPNAGRRDVAYLVHKLWDSIRAKRYGPTPANIESVLSTAAVGGVLHELSECLYLLVATGDLLTTLRTERARLDATIARLERHAAPSR